MNRSASSWAARKHSDEHDPLFPVTSVRDAFAVLRRVWESQGAGDRLETRIWPARHLFDREMQDAAFTWLDRQFQLQPQQP